MDSTQAFVLDFIVESAQVCPLTACRYLSQRFPRTVDVVASTPLRQLEVDRVHKDPASLWDVVIVDLIQISSSKICV
jgi:hypothetical protein